MVTRTESITRYLAKIGESISVPERAPNRVHRIWKSTVPRKDALADQA